MTFKTDIINDMSVFLNTGEFATDAIYKTNTIQVIFDQTSDNFDVGEVEIVRDRIEILANQSDVTGVVIGDVIDINAVTYYIIDIDDQGETNTTGFIRLILSLEMI